MCYKTKVYFLFFSVILSFCLFGIIHAQSYITMSNISGEVLVKFSGETEWQVADEKMKLIEGDTVECGKDGSVILSWFEGNSVMLKPLTIFKISKLYRDPATNEYSVINLEIGKMTAKVKKLHLNSSFQVYTPSASAAVRGTLFHVAVDGNDTTFAVVEGKLEIIAQEVIRVLEENMQLVVMESIIPSFPEPISPELKMEINEDSGTMSEIAPTPAEKSQKGGSESSKQSADDEVQRSLLDMLDVKKGAINVEIIFEE